ncbi:hypothetical protein [Abyssalbus ytuae]|uniref:Uncharacterized protein n=1 Tax=Abyssalbus ytuae TaxID=2926907 RepID=A0A9E6ZYF4_9FLAO|nr:hypothetical protein [Abyssalbus ytuae]UOB19261.1 hypothetical protein MQE35_08160 [Abyssalbus ytuae]
MNEAIKYLKFLSNSIDNIIDLINGADVEFKIDFEKTLRLYDQLRHESLEEFCQNEAFGYFMSHGNNTQKNRDLYAKTIKEYILLKRH